MYLKCDRVLTALSIMLDVAFYAGRSGVVSGGDIAQRGGLLRRGIEPILQALSRAELLDSVRGPKGGYRLGRSQRVITLRDIAEAVGSVDPASALEEKRSNLLFHKVVQPFWQTLDEEVAVRMGEVSLDDLVRQAEDTGLKRPNRVPISFSI